ncbi:MULTISPECIES: CsoS2 family carboxysome shell protein [unclassified Cyanobium]|uniref:carboxysome assembly protein CsoS2 n=1 Tax=unclassified Cyanobium TaxID=2627006 RepID=UPI0020CF1C73|nr:MULTISPECIES: CsoS2 family carboxysome shell protein [unclassified Cyanobium]MCP9832964.1 CsoS2 family carboxysome shell protein [Cyanobium sp. La Preciosa 7G6]MCP9935714.1 CsoS2 family carboxysome shell protein [Cyanobium sp. Aljojuca 7A6]
MAKTTSREAALERRKALTNGGKKASAQFMSSPGRVRTAADVQRPSPEAVSPAPAPAPTSPRSSATPRRASASLTSASGSGHRSNAKPLANPSRNLVLERREALSRRGKRADTSSDRTRQEVMRATKASQSAATPAVAVASDRPCGCKDAKAAAAASSNNSAGLGASLANRNARNGNGERRSVAKRTAQHNPSRAIVMARREALSKRGKSASAPTSAVAASVARQSNPDMSSRELAQKVRELKCKVGSAGSSRSGGSRPTGPRRGQAKIDAAADAHWKVGVSETVRGQVVTGTQANRSLKTTGNEASTCRPVTGTEYMGAEIFRTFCQSEPTPLQPAKVRVSATSHGNRVTGNEVGRSEKVTGDEPGTCKTITGTEYISANQSATWCGTSAPAPSPRKVGFTRTVEGRPVSGVSVERSEKVTGNEPGSNRQLTGTQYMDDQAQVPGRAPAKVSSLHTLRGTGITGTHVGRSEHVTGDEPGSCRLVTGDEYIGTQQFEQFCGTKPAPEAAKVGFSVTNKALVVSGTRTGRSEKVTGDEPGTCKAVTGTPYAGMEQAGTWCSSDRVAEIRQRTPARMGTVMTGLQPGIGGVMTGAERGACEDITGTPYIGGDQLTEACGAASSHDADFPQPLTGQPWQQFSVQSPARAAHTAQTARQRPGGVTGNSYEQGNRITGPFDMAADKVTGTEQFRFDRPGPERVRLRQPPAAASVTVDEDARPTSRVTGEGLSAGLNITGDDWGRGKHVTGTEGASARRRNPSRVGPISAMPGFQNKRNEALPEPTSKISGSCGSTNSGSLITVSGGARG